jgi:hypothetical protein
VRCLGLAISRDAPSEVARWSGVDRQLVHDAPGDHPLASRQAVAGLQPRTTDPRYRHSTSPRPASHPPLHRLRGCTAAGGRRNDHRDSLSTGRSVGAALGGADCGWRRPRGTSAYVLGVAAEDSMIKRLGDRAGGLPIVSPTVGPSRRSVTRRAAGGPRRPAVVRRGAQRTGSRLRPGCRVRRGVRRAGGAAQ